MNGPDEPLDFGLIADIPKSEEHFERLAQLHWEFYSELAFLRNQIYDSLKGSLRERAGPFEFPEWQRAVKYRYCLVPLSTKGSLSDPGGRFNIGAIDPSRFPVFPALYLASDKKTALAELLGRDGPADSLTPEELALTKPTSITVVSVSGKLESVLDVRDAKNLASFATLCGARFDQCSTATAIIADITTVSLLLNSRMRSPRERGVTNFGRSR
jgi:RES domain